jgi:drug/metabolite transporter (DMT)-like permease
MILGIIIIASPFNSATLSASHVPLQRTAGIVVGLISGFSYAVLSLMNRNFSGKYESEVIVFHEQAWAAVFILPFFIIQRPAISAKDLLLLAILGIVFTAIAHGLFVKGLRHIKVTSAGIISALEVVYSILLASFLLKEIPMLNEIIGGLIVVSLAAYITATGQKKLSSPIAQGGAN